MTRSKKPATTAKKGSTKATKPAKATSKKVTAQQHVDAAKALEAKGDWKGAATSWRAAAQAASSRSDAAKCAGFAAAADVRANAAHDDLATDVEAKLEEGRARKRVETASAATAEEMAAEAKGQPKPARAAKEPKAKREPKPAKAPAAFTHDERVLPFVGKTLTHTDRNGATFAVQVLEDGFEMGGARFKSLSAAAKEASGGASVNGLLYFGVIKTERKLAPADHRAAIEKAAATLSARIAAALAAGATTGGIASLDRLRAELA